MTNLAIISKEKDFKYVLLYSEDVNPNNEKIFPAIEDF